MNRNQKRRFKNYLDDLALEYPAKKKPQRWQKLLKPGDLVETSEKGDRAFILDGRYFKSDGRAMLKMGYVLCRPLGMSYMFWTERRHIIKKVNK